MTKRQISNSTNGNLLAKSFFLIYVLLIAGGLVAGIIILNNSIPSGAIKLNNSDNIDTPSRIFDQTTVDSVNKLDGSSTTTPTGRTNPFSE